MRKILKKGPAVTTKEFEKKNLHSMVDLKTNTGHKNSKAKFSNSAFGSMASKKKNINK